MSNNHEILPQKEIENKIYNLRGVQVMLDKDLAAFYGVKAIRLREQIKRNPNRFPDDFAFQLDEIEVEYMVSQNAIPSKQSLGGSLPFAFTEQGVAAVAGVLKSKKADEISVAIARAFVTMRKFLVYNASVFTRLDKMEIKQIKTDVKIEQLFKALEAGKPEPDKGIFFEGQIFDAWVFASDIIKRAKRDIILIDNYVDDTVLTLLVKRKKQVTSTIYTKAISNVLILDLEKHNSQYAPIVVKVFTHSHDRFLIIDRKELYHLGASLKDLGKKWFAFSRMDSLVGEVLVKIEL